MLLLQFLRIMCVKAIRMNLSQQDFILDLFNTKPVKPVIDGPEGYDINHLLWAMLETSNSPGPPTGVMKDRIRNLVHA